MYSSVSSSLCFVIQSDAVDAGRCHVCVSLEFHLCPLVVSFLVWFLCPLLRSCLTRDNKRHECRQGWTWLEFHWIYFSFLLLFLMLIFVLLFLLSPLMVFHACHYTVYSVLLLFSSCCSCWCPLSWLLSLRETVLMKTHFQSRDCTLFSLSLSLVSLTKSLVLLLI